MKGVLSQTYLYRTAIAIVSFMIQVQLMAYYDGNCFCIKFNQIYSLMYLIQHCLLNLIKYMSSKSLKCSWYNPTGHGIRLIAQTPKTYMESNSFGALFTALQLSMQLSFIYLLLNKEHRISLFTHLLPWSSLWIDCH